MSFYPSAYYNFYGSQMFDPYEQSQVHDVHYSAAHPQPLRQVQLPTQNQQIDSQAQNGAQPEIQQSKGKAPAKPPKKHDSFLEVEEKYLINLWISYHERLESKDSRKYWSKLVDELNAKYHNKRAVDKCKRRIKYLIEKYKERKDWNRKQSGGHLWKSPFYDEIDSVLGCRDVVAFERVGEAGSESSEKASEEQSTSSSPTPASTSSISSSPKGTLNNGETQDNRRKRKKSKASDMRLREEDEREDKLLKTMSEQGDRMAEVINKMQDSQAKQMEIMNDFMKTMTEMMKNAK